MKNDFPSKDARRNNPNASADAALDGELSLEALFDSPRASRSNAAHVQVFRRLERLLRLEKNSAKTPDFTAAVLNEVGTRRGWLEAPSRRFVLAGRVVAAATLLAAIGTTLGLRRAMPELTGPSPESAAVALVVDASERAAAKASTPLASVVETIGHRKPVLAQLTSTFEHASDGTANQPVFAVHAARLPQNTGGRAVVVRVSLDPASQQTVDAVAGLNRSPRWVRELCEPNHKQDQK